jgi:hypothetical protein
MTARAHMLFLQLDEEGAVLRKVGGVLESPV